MANKNVARGRETRDQFVRVATRLFAAHGYDGTSIEAVLQETGASRGSLYHHFPGKEALFLAVVHDMEARIVATVTAAAAEETDPVEALAASCRAWIRLAGEPDIQQIVVTDAPAVLGWQHYRELDEQAVLGLIRMAVAAAARAGRLEERHVDLFAHLILAAVNEAAILTARSPEVLPAAQATFDEFLKRLLR